MMVPSSQTNRARTSRREFLKSYAAAAVGGGVAARLVALPPPQAGGSDEIRIGLVGCGERGTGAVDNALAAAPNVKLFAMGDVFGDKIELSLKALKELGRDVEVPEERRFVGLNACTEVLASGANYIILATPPGFRPLHLEAACAAGKNIFAEKPVAVDGPGIRTVLAAYQEAKSKGLKIGVGLQRHHQTGYLETLKRIHDGAIGEITAARAYWDQGPIWVHPRQAGWSDLAWQLRNWYYFTWLSGDHIVEQHIHNLDVINWALGGHPVRAVGMGGRQVRTGPEYGNIYDHFCTDYEYGNGVHMMSMCRQMPDCENNVGEDLAGTKGFCQLDKYTITGEDRWRFASKDSRPYVQEHADLIAAIRADDTFNELETAAESTLTAIMGRMAAYTGKAVTWEQALNSQENLMPAKLDWEASLPVPPVAMPGQTQLG